MKVVCRVQKFAHLIHRVTLSHKEGEKLIHCPLIFKKKNRANFFLVTSHQERVYLKNTPTFALLFGILLTKHTKNTKLIMSALLI